MPADAWTELNIYSGNSWGIQASLVSFTIRGLSFDPLLTRHSIPLDKYFRTLEQNVHGNPDLSSLVAVGCYCDLGIPR